MLAEGIVVVGVELPHGEQGAVEGQILKCLVSFFSGMGMEALQRFIMESLGDRTAVIGAILIRTQYKRTVD